MKLPDQSLMSAYRQSEFSVSGPEPILLRIDQPIDTGAKWLEALDCGSAVVITAFNPFSKALSELENLESNLKLEDDIKTNGLSYFDASGASSDESWPAEPGFCVLDPELSLVDDWMCRFGQYAVVMVTAADGCQLLWHPSVRSLIDDGDLV